MGFFSKNEQEVPGEKKAVQEVAMRTMQQDLSFSKKGESAGQTRMESVERHSGLKQEKTIAKVAPPIAPVALPHLAEMEHRREKTSSSDVPEIKAIPIMPSVPISSSPDIPKIPKPIGQVPIPKTSSAEPVKIVRPAEISGSTNLLEAPVFSKPSVPMPPAKSSEVESSKLKVQSPTDDNKHINNKRMEIPKPKFKDDSFQPKKVDPAFAHAGTMAGKVSKRKIVWGLAGGIVVVALAIGGYFVIPMIFAPKTVDTPVIVQEEPVVIVELPDISDVPEFVENDFKLMDFDLEYDIDVDQDELIDNYQNNIALIIAEKLSVQDLILAQEFIDVQFSIDKEFPPAEIMVSGIFSGFPQDISDRMTSKYNVVAYAEGDSSRLGLILEINDIQAVQEILLDWEQTMPDDLALLYLSDPLNLENVSSEDFVENIYSDINIRYKNFSTPDMAIEYALVGDKLIFATSKDSMFSLIDYVVIVNADNVEELSDSSLSDDTVPIMAEE
ncbi:hypothetical protein D4R87_02615 [bacterium]|nr:MAG: hypothetical protein D4R87_02615 [bacterium]